MVCKITSERVFPKIYRIVVGMPKSWRGYGKNMSGAIREYVKEADGFSMIGDVKLVDSSNERYSKEAVLMVSTTHTDQTVDRKMYKLLSFMEDVVNENLFLEREQI